MKQMNSQGTGYKKNTAKNITTKLSIPRTAVAWNKKTNKTAQKQKESWKGTWWAHKQLHKNALWEKTEGKKSLWWCDGVPSPWTNVVQHWRREHMEHWNKEGNDRRADRKK